MVLTRRPRGRSMIRANVEEIIDWVRYAETDEAVAVSAGFIRSLAAELLAARRVVGYAALSKLYLSKDEYHDIVREVEAYEALFDEG